MKKIYLVLYYHPVTGTFNLTTFDTEEEMKSFCRKSRSYINAVYTEIKVFEVIFKDEDENGVSLIDDVKVIS